uniref:Uncharacterized protein n=1 Tax=Rhizophora mucronata TaxID=61149 RepID=A0A2P2LZ98_RHIMU
MQQKVISHLEKEHDK